MQAKICTEQIERLIVKLGKEFSFAAIIITFVDIIVTGDSATVAGFRLDLVRLL